MYSKCCMRQTIIPPTPRFFIEVFISVSCISKGRNGQILEVKVPRTYITSWKTLSEGNYPALTRDEDKIILPFIFVYNK